VQAVLTGAQPAHLAVQRKAYRTYVESMLGQVLAESPWAAAVAGLLYGSQAWVDRMRRLLKGERREQTALRALEERPGWEQVRQAVEQVKGEAWERFCARHGDWGRDLALYVARRSCGVSLRALGKHVGLDNYYAVAQAILRFDRRLRQEPERQKALSAVLKCINVKT